jgi:hypothetical protein
MFLGALVVVPVVGVLVNGSEAALVRRPVRIMGRSEGHGSGRKGEGRDSDCIIIIVLISLLCVFLYRVGCLNLCFL